MHSPAGRAAGSRRAGAQALSLFASPLNPLILSALRHGPLRLAELRQAAGGPAQTTLRAYLANLIEAGLLVKTTHRAMPYAVAHELTGEGRELLFVLEVTEAWLAKAPLGEIALGTEAAKAAIKALTDGWDSSILQSLAARPLCLTELDRLISTASYPALERRLASMRLTGLLEPAPSNSNATPYAVTDWARRAIAPLIAAAYWERANLPGPSEPAISRSEVEAAFLLALALVELAPSTEGECVLAVDTKATEQRIAGVHLIIERGAITTCETELGPEPPTYALGSAEAWLEAVIARAPAKLHTRGEHQLVFALVQGLHQVLFGG